jgi:hypothetical protein
MMRTRTLVVLGGGLLAVLVLMATAFAPQARAAHLPQPVGINSASPLAALQPFTQTITCQVNITTTPNVSNNFTPGSAATVATYGGLALIPQTNVPPPTSIVPTVAVDNWFILINATANYSYTFAATPDLSQNYNIGMELYGAPPSFPGAATLLAQDINTGDGTGAQLSYSFPGVGPYYIRVFQISSYCSGSTYSLRFTSLAPTPVPSITPSPTKTIGPSATPYAGAPSVDVFEPNNNFDQATTLGLNVKYDNLNFVQWDVNSTEWDNDFFKVRVKPGMLVTCRTLQLKPGTDTNLILYDQNLNGINGSDDVDRANGDLSSSVTYFVTYEGWLYGLAGEGFARPRSEQAGTGYSFECTITNQSSPTPGPTATDAPNVPTRTPIPTETPIPSPTLTPTPPFIGVKPLPTATPPGLPTQQVPVSLLTYYDVNGNNKYDPGEGIVGISARVIDLTTGKLLAQGLTDTTGRVSFTVSAPGAVQLVVPYLNRSEIILPSGKAVTIRVSPSALPSVIP